MNWIRIVVGIEDDPKIEDLADALKITLPHAVGLVVCTLGKFPAHAIDGDISRITDKKLERWSGWTGKAGAFATAFRDLFCTDGVVASWMRHNGAPIRKAEANAEYKRQERERKRSGGRGVRPDGTPDGTPPVTSPGGSNETNETNETNEEEEGAVAPSSAGLAAEFADEAHRAAYAGARRSARNPETFDAMLGSLANGMGAPRGKPLTWHQLGTAILHIQGQPVPPPLTPNVIAGYAAKVPHAPAAPTLSLFRGDLPGTIRDQGGTVVWHPGMPSDRPGDDEITANGWSVAA